MAVLRRIGVFALTALVASVVVFALLNVLPGDVARAQLGMNASDADVERMSAFAAQAAVAIDNATLFSDVAAERNYNESILRSMSSGVPCSSSSRTLPRVSSSYAAVPGFAA